jgi:hypothetical protein
MKSTGVIPLQKKTVMRIEEEKNHNFTVWRLIPFVSTISIDHKFKRTFFFSIVARCTALCDKVCQWLATSRLFFLGPPDPVSSANKTDRHNIIEILLKVASYTTKQTRQINLFYNESLLIPLLHTLFPIPSSLYTIPPMHYSPILIYPIHPKQFPPIGHIQLQYTANSIATCKKIPI